MRKTVLIGALMLGLTATAGGAAADTLSLVCRVHETRGHAERNLLRRLDIDLATRKVRFSDDTGQGWRFKSEYTFLSADADRIRLEAGDGKESYVDRRTGDYLFRNQKENLMIRGHCEKAAAEKPRF